MPYLIKSFRNTKKYCSNLEEIPRNTVLTSKDFVLSNAWWISSRGYKSWLVVESLAKTRLIFGYNIVCMKVNVKIIENSLFKNIVTNREKFGI